MSNKSGITFIAALLAASIGAGGAGYLGARWIAMPAPEKAAPVYDGPRLAQFDKGYVAPAGRFNIRVRTPEGVRAVAADISVGFATQHQAAQHLETDGLLRLRQAVLLSLSDVAGNASIDAADNWVEELTASLASIVPTHLPGVVELQVNSATRNGA